MIQTAFVAYWSDCYPATCALLVLLVLRRIWTFPVPAVGSTIARILASDWGIFDKAVIGLGVAHCAFYLWLPNFADYGEPVMPLLASNYLHGAPVYADWRAGQAIVGSNYGPYAFLSQLPVLLWHPTIAASKLVGVGFGLGGLLLLLLAVRGRMRSAADGLSLCALMVVMLSFEQHYWFWNRPDSALIAIVALGTLLFDRTRPAACLACLGLLAGVAINLKLFGAIYLVPLAVGCIPMVRCWSALFGAMAIGGGLFAAALALPFWGGQVSLHNYIANLAMMPHQGVIVSAVIQSLFYGMVILSLPTLTWRAVGAEPEDRVMTITLGVCSIIVAAIAGKPGGGPPYMMPLIPLSLYLSARLSSREIVAQPTEAAKTRRLVLCAVAICAAPIWAYSWFQLAKQIPHFREEQAKATELRGLFAAFPGAEMGHSYGSGAGQDEFYRVEKAFLGQVTRFDYVNFADQREAGLSASVLYPLFEGCRVPNWILPVRGGRFLGTGYTMAPLLDEGALERFRSNYELAGQYRFYEVWRCREHADPALATERFR